MATNDKAVNVSVDPMERQWLEQALKTQRNVLVRSLSKERAGSEIYELRRREIAQVDAILAKVV